MAMPAYSFAEGVTVNCSILSSESVGATLNGTMRVEVTNLTGSAIRNVDLRLENSVPNSIEKDLFQFGSVPAGKSGVVTGGFRFMGGLENPIVWKIDYDDAEGAHKQIMVQGILEDLSKGSK